jgi:hypothetical protein
MAVQLNPHFPYDQPTVPTEALYYHDENGNRLSINYDSLCLPNELNHVIVDSGE